MSVIPLTIAGPAPSVVTHAENFRLHGTAILIQDVDEAQLEPREHECNVSYDLRVGNLYRDHKPRRPVESLDSDNDFITLLPGSAAIITTKEVVHFPTTIFGHILPRVTLLQNGIANTPTKVDPGYHGSLLITVFNHGRRTERLKRNAAFCALYLMSVAPEAQPYDKPGKQLVGPPQGRGLRRWVDWVEANPWIAIISAPLTVILSLIAILRTL